MPRFLLVLSLLVLSLGCSDAAGPDGDGVRIRIGNDSESSFTSVAVTFPEDQVDYGSVEAGSTSDYRRVSVAYRMAYVVVRVGSTEQQIQPIDYVGEEPLEPGRYTYSLSFLDGYLQLELKRDD